MNNTHSVFDAADVNGCIRNWCSRWNMEHCGHPPPMDPSPPKPAASNGTAPAPYAIVNAPACATRLTSAIISYPSATYAFELTVLGLRMIA